MKKILAILLAVLIAVSAAPMALAYTTEAYQAATHLNQLGLLGGTGTNPDGTPNFDLDAKPTRAQGIVMLLALLGERNDATSKEWRGPFTDVPSWARKYVNYAYQKKYTGGVSATRFGTNNPLTPNQYLTFVLKAMGYSPSTDFSWKDPYPLTDRLGITGGKYNNNSRFTRGDMVIVSNNALNAKMKKTDQTLYEALLAAGKVKDPGAEPSGSKIQQLAQYIDSHGSTVSDGTKAIRKTVKFDIYELKVAFSFDSINKLIYMFCDVPNSNSVGMIINTATNKVESYCWYKYDDSTQKYTLEAKNLDPAAYTQNTILSFAATEDCSIPAALLPTLQDLANRCTPISLGAWAVYLESIGFSLADLGFGRFLASIDTGSTPIPQPTASPSPVPQVPAAQQLAQYISSHGQMDSNGDMAVSFEQSLTNGRHCSQISYDKAEGKLYFYYTNVSGISGVELQIVSRYDLAADRFENMTLMEYYLKNSTQELTFTMTATDIDPASFTYQSTGDFQFRENPSSVPLDKAAELANVTLRTALLVWTGHLATLKYNIADFGYTRFYASIPNSSPAPGGSPSPSASPTPAATPSPSAPAGRLLAEYIDKEGLSDNNGSKFTVESGITTNFNRGDDTYIEYDTVSTITYDKAKNRLCFQAEEKNAAIYSRYRVTAYFDLAKNAFEPDFQIEYLDYLSNEPFLTMKAANLDPGTYRKGTLLNFNITYDKHGSGGDGIAPPAPNAVLFMTLQLWRYQVWSCSQFCESDVDFFEDMGFTQFYSSF